MPKILITHADIVTLDPQGTVLRNADVAIEGERIVAVGQAPADFRPDEVVEARNHVLMPGFVNAHTHAPMTFERGWAEDLPLDRWFNERVWVVESQLTADDVYWGALLAAAEMIRSGTVAFADHYFYMDRVAEAVEQAGLRALLAWCVFGEEGNIGTDLPGTVDFVQRWQGAAGDRIHTVLGPHSPYMCEPRFLARTAAVAARLGVGIHIHLAESQAQVDNSLARYDRTPVELLEANGVFDVPVIAAHCIYVNEVDQAILARRGVTVVQCPNCHMKLGMGVTPVPALLAQGVNVALGTDGPASSNDLNMLKEARLAALIQKLHRADPQVMPGDLPLRMATQNGARALGWPDSGAILPGYRADLILLDCDKPHWRPRHDLVANLLHSAQAGDVSDVMVAGRWLMRRRQLLTLDEQRILWEAERRALALVDKDLTIVRAYQA
ncbi:MAG: amidohydrolase [Caldilineales bacterium]|nr:amidohydrolase [Caldilineales bacterium]MDW8318642.1 amidohydrolase [Anaerolineae bacterium]